METLVCNRCGEEKSISDFSLKRGTNRGRAYACKLCHSKYRKEHYENNRDKYIQKAKIWDSENEYYKRGRYGLTAEEYRGMLDKYQGKCWICKAREATHVDHDHACCGTNLKSCGKCVRGLLCQSCNSMLGFARDRVDILEQGMIYLQS